MSVADGISEKAEREFFFKNAQDKLFCPVDEFGVE
jgi:hypothetical protein